MTALEPNEIVTGVTVPSPGIGVRAGGTYLKLERKVGDFATVGVAVHVVFADGGTVERAGIALTAVGPTNVRARAAEQALAG
ncbi:MAG: xanthine dehydrogenase family protein subunit M, partial [Solirubrobacteraceae bacterium]